MCAPGQESTEIPVARTSSAAGYADRSMDRGTVASEPRVSPKCRTNAGILRPREISATRKDGPGDTLSPLSGPARSISRAASRSKSRRLQEEARAPALSQGCLAAGRSVAIPGGSSAIAGTAAGTLPRTPRIFWAWGATVLSMTVWEGER